MRSYFCFNRILAGVMCLLLTATLFYACSKSNTDVTKSNTNDNLTLSAASDQAIALGYFDDLFVVAQEVCRDAGYSQTGRKAAHDINSKLGSCYKYTVDDVQQDNWPKTILVSFDAGCADESGRIRVGTIQITMSGYFYYTGSVITIKPLTYTVNGKAITGTQTITNASNNSGYKYLSVISGGSVTLDTTTVGFGGRGTYTQTAGTATLGDVYDDIFTYAGTDSLVYATGKTAYITVADSSALERKLSCAFIGKGKATVTFNAMSAILDYGNGVCDDSLTVSVGDKVKTIKLPK
ncbi:hypothetical protein [Chitinophaga sancti]|uniref:Lipoprotein n=1 Tax=Chitinophaga sancti TaxID=1004 RepID=A0A1K1SEQ0_9BACT|nr:hypothetical protein [Chitinophaga sancti]WQD60013.1 hypothetical protein U0033_19165 [Chitinophaga sancti]WQG87857.1 hypothetical protein SR876_23300 [Chitinophaga sancti]SFW82722.1 hypothetical protein SAMN05661012_05299 [Chitinophaga sancti]